MLLHNVWTAPKLNFDWCNKEQSTQAHKHINCTYTPVKSILQLVQGSVKSASAVSQFTLWENDAVQMHAYKLRSSCTKKMKFKITINDGFVHVFTATSFCQVGTVCLSSLETVASGADCQPSQSQDMSHCCPAPFSALYTIYIIFMQMSDFGYCTYIACWSVFTALFPGPPGWAGARRELLDFMVQKKTNRGRHTDHPAGRHSIWTKRCPPPPSLHFLQARCPSCRRTNSVKALKATSAFGLGRRR